MTRVLACCCALGAGVATTSVRAGDGAVSGSVAVVTGPDLVISVVAHDTIANWGSELPDGASCLDTNDRTCTAAFSIGTTSCNLGDEPARWEVDTNRHPAIRQGMYRLLNGRFEQIGTSWVKHGFLATNEEAFCTPSCVNPGTQNGFDNLRPGCSDPYGSVLNGNRQFLGPASAVNAFTGYFPQPVFPAPGSGAIDNRIQVAHVDLDRGLNINARYFGEAHYVTADDALARNGENNAAYVALNIFIEGEDMSGFNTNCFTPYCAWDVGPTFTEDPAIRAWKEADPSVLLTDKVVPGEGLFILGVKVTDLGGRWKYEYALANLNSDRSGGSFEVPVPDGADIQNIGFHDINYHSGEPWDGTDWTAVVVGQTLTWSTTSFDVDPNANALRWSTLYNFRFEVDAPPENSSVIVGLFKPGQPERIAIQTSAPQLTILDCNENGIADGCDVACGITCDPNTCGMIADCNNNGVPDDPMCEVDCDGNGIPDSCDLADCQGELWCGDCNQNTVPDTCDADCDADGIPDDCDPEPDRDQDGIENCLDLCPDTTPVGACLPVQDVWCLHPNNLCNFITRTQCFFLGGEPVCGDPTIQCAFRPPCPDSECRDGCLVGDYDRDGDIDFVDVGSFQMCFSGALGSIKYQLPSAECLLRFDFDPTDDDVDLDDFLELFDLLSGP